MLIVIMILEEKKVPAYITGLNKALKCTGCRNVISVLVCYQILLIISSF